LPSARGTVQRFMKVGLALALVAGCGVKEIPVVPVAVPGTGGQVVPPPTGGAGGAGGGEAVPIVADAAVAGSGGGETPAPGDGGAAPPPAPSPADAAMAPSGPPPAALPPGGPFGAGATRDKVIAFVHIGHSNMAGRATEPASQVPYFFTTDPRLWSFHGMDMIHGTPPWTWRQAKEPLSPDGETLPGQAGPGMAILHAAEAAGQPDQHFISVGHGQSGMNLGYCVSYKKGGILYEIAMAPARQLRGHVTWGGIFTMLGTTERHRDVAEQNGFSDCMAQVAADMRADLGDPNIPFMMSDFEMEATGDTSPNLPYAKIVIAQLRIAETKIPRAALIPTNQLGMEGSHHFNLAGHKEWGLRGIQILKDKGWAPWAR
jgi:hypothetical protein